VQRDLGFEFGPKLLNKIAVFGILGNGSEIRGGGTYGDRRGEEGKGKALAEERAGGNGERSQ